jgi:predicted ATPase
MITRLEATRYRCFEQLSVDMSAFQVIVGANGSGKTTLIDLPSLFGELLRADNIASVFTLKRGSLPARAAALRELVFAGRGDDFSLALEVVLPEDQRSAWVEAWLANIKSKRQQEVLRNSPDKWPSHLRYELRLEVFNERELNVKNEYLFAFSPSSVPDRLVGGLLGETNQDKEDWHFILRRVRRTSYFC